MEFAKTILILYFQNEEITFLIIYFSGASNPVDLEAGVWSLSSG